MKYKTRSRKNLDWNWDQATVQGIDSASILSISTRRSLKSVKTSGNHTVNTTRTTMTRTELLASRKGCMSMIVLALLCPLIYLLPVSIFNLEPYRILYAPDLTLSAKAEPSYKRMCRAMLDGSGGRSQKIYENMSTCLEKQDLSAALSQMFASAFLSEASKQSQISVSYQHKCHMRLFDNDDGGKTTVQQLLPLEMKIIKPQSVAISSTSLEQLCEDVLEMGDKQGAWAILDYTLDSSKTVLEAMMPTIRKTLHFTIEAWDQAGRGVGGYKIQETVAGYLVQTAKKFDGHGPLKKLKANDGTRAAIYLPCLDLQCTDSYILPNYFFPLFIPNSIKKLDLIVPFKCFTEIEGCRLYANTLAKFLVEFFPRADVMLIRHKEDAYMDTFSRIFLADYAVCGPGPSTACAFPILSRRENTFMNIINDGAMEHSSEDFLTGRLASSYFTGVEFESVEGVQKVSMFGEDLNFTYTNQNLPDDGKCRYIRGRRGGWVKDKEYSKFGQYASALKHFFGLEDMQHRELISAGSLTAGTFRDPSSYDWRDGRGVMTANGPSCQTEYTTLATMCQVTNDLNLGKILFVGDSLSLNQALSLYKLLDQKETPSLSNQGSTFKELIRCNSTGTEFEFEFVRNDKMEKVTEEVAAYRMKENTNEYVGQWEPRLMDSEQRTLLVFNFGTFMDDVTTFEKTFSRIIGALDTMNRQREKKDIIFFRTSVQGHDKCEKVGNKIPYLTYGDYVKDRDDNPDPSNLWRDIETQNDIVTRQIEKRRRTKTKWGARIELLDVHPTTVLRPDGHVGRYLDKRSEFDCIHYSLPGPVDFWNHIMTSNLADIAIEEMMESIRQHDAPKAES